MIGVIQRPCSYHGYYIGLWLFILIPLSTLSQTNDQTIYDLDLNQLSKLKISSASKTDQAISEVPSTIYVITGDQIHENGYFTLEEALSDLPGFQFRNILGINSYVFQRGIPNQNNLTLVLIDGVQINELNSGGFYAGGQYNMANIERIEIIYGPSSVAYGTNAVTGIINIITKGPSEKRTTMNVLKGSYNTIEGDVTYSHINDKGNLGVSVSGMLKRSDKADLAGEAGDNNWTDLMENFENDNVLDMKIKINDFTIGTNYIRKAASTTTMFKSVGTHYLDHGSLWNIQFVNNYVKYNKKISGKISLSSLLYNRNATVLKSSVFYVLDTAQIGCYRPNNLTGLENIINYEACDFFSVTGGLSLEYEQLAEKYSLTVSSSSSIRPPTPTRPNMVSNSLISVFAEPRITLFDKIHLSGGVRFDQSTIYNQVLTPRAGLVYVMSPLRFRLSYAQAFRAPKAWDYTDGIENPSLLPEKMNSLETAVSLTNFNHISVDLTGYKNVIDNAIKMEWIGDQHRWINSGQLRVDGVEVYVRYGLGRLRSSVNYTLNYSRDETGVAIPEISKHSGNGSLTYSFNEHVKFNLRANFIGKRKNPILIASTNSKELGPYLIFHGALTLMNHKGINLQLSAKNLFDKTYYHTSNRDPNRYRQPQRTIMLSVGYALKD